MFRVLAVIVLVLALTACSSHSRADESESLVPVEAGDLDGTAWVLVADGETDAVPESRALTIAFADGTASGDGPCNTFNMEFVVDGDDVTTGPVASTRIACEPPLGDAEASYFVALEAVDTAEKQADRLVLTGPDDVRLVFERADDDD